MSKHNKKIMLVSAIIAIAFPIFVAVSTMVNKEHLGVTTIVAVLGALGGFLQGAKYYQTNSIPDVRKAWYWVDGVLLEGCTEKQMFYPNVNRLCWFSEKGFTEQEVGKLLFYDLEKAVRVCGDVRVVTH